jgi:hypothetical protein
MNEIILFAHPTFGVLAIIAAVWVLVETLNVSPANLGRVRAVAAVTAAFMVLSWVLGGYWYVNYYGPEKAMILRGPWPWAHSIVMETKEHLFFIPLILALYLPIAAAADLIRSQAARAMVITVATLVVLSGLAIEGGGAIINYGVKVALMQSQAGVKGAK